MKRILGLILLALLMSSSFSFASVGIRVNGSMVGTATDLNINCGNGTNTTVTNDGSIYNINCNSVLLATGVANGGVTSLATIDSGISVGFALIRKSISNLGTLTDTLPNGYPGQMLTIAIDIVTGGGTWTVTPTTATDWKSIVFSLQGQRATFIYLNDTAGWILQSADGTASGAAPVVNYGN